MSAQENPDELQRLLVESQVQVGQLVRLVRTLSGGGCGAAAGAMLAATARPGHSQISPAPAAAAITPHAAKPQNVLVVNSGNQTVPVTGGVQAQQSGTWNVGSNGTPTVQVSSSANSPVIVKDASHSSRQPFETQLVFQYPQGVAYDFQNLPQVPAGKRQVIETENVNGDTPRGQQIFARIDADSTISPGTSVPHFFPAQRCDANSSQSAYSTKIYIGPGVTPSVLAERTGSANGFVGIGVTVGGYYEDAN